LIAAIVSIGSLLFGIYVIAVGYPGSINGGSSI